MLGANLDAITIADLQGLVEDGIPEGKTIEYKREFYRLDGKDPDDKKRQHEELLKDVSSFANTAGGDLIIGMDAVGGVPVSICGFDCHNKDALKLRLTEIVQNGLEPRISFAIHSMTVSAGKAVFIIRVRRSVFAPHRVVYRGEFGQFWARTTAGAHRMDTSELRLAFTLTEAINEKIRNFRRDRVCSILVGATPIPLSRPSKLICHLIPQESFASRLNFDVDVLSRIRFPLCGSQSLENRTNLDGVATLEREIAYTQAYRNGIVEIVCDGITSLERDDAKFFRVQVLDYFIECVRRCLAKLSSLGIQPPVWLFLTLSGVKGSLISVPRVGCESEIDRDLIELPELEIPELLTADCASLLRPLFDMVWNAAGHLRCFNLYDEHGKYKPNR